MIFTRNIDIVNFRRPIFTVCFSIINHLPDFLNETHILEHKKIVRSRYHDKRTTNRHSIARRIDRLKLELVISKISNVISEKHDFVGVHFL